MSKLTTTYTPALASAALVAAALSAIATAEVLYLFYALNSNYAMIGSVLGLSALSLVFLAPFLHKAARKMGYGLFLVWSCLLLACASLAAALAFSAGVYAVPKALLALFAPIIIPVFVELVREVFRFAKDLERLLVLLSLVVAGAGAVGAVASGVVADNFGFSFTYVFAAVLFFLAGMSAILLPRIAPPHAFTKLPVNPVARLQPALKKPVAPLALAAFSLQAYWAVRDFVFPFIVYSAESSVTSVGIVFGAMSLASVIGVLVVQHLLSKNPSPQVLVSAFVVGAGCALLLPFGPVLLLGLAACGFSLSESVASPAISGAVEKATPQRSSHLVCEGFRTVSALAWVITPILLGILLEAGMPARMVLFFAGTGMVYVYLRLQQRFTPEDVFPSLKLRSRKRRW